MRKRYEEPEIQFKKLCLDETIASTCWGYAANEKDHTFYYNLEGPGSLEFKIVGKNCNIAQPTEVFYVVDKNGNNIIDGGNSGERVNANSEQRIILSDAMHHDGIGGNSGENFSGNDFSDDFNPSWS